MSGGPGSGAADPAGGPPRSPRQPRMGPAPFASFEELSDEVRCKPDSPDDKPVIRLPDISEDVNTPSGQSAPAALQAGGAMENLGHNPTTPLGPLNLQTPSTPRIDISRASSSSHHDSRDSSPENAIFGVSEGEKSHEGTKLGLGFREDGTADLRSSTEELAFLEPNAGVQEKETSTKSCRKSPLMFKPEDPHRKDSQCSDIVLLSISGRTSRLSSIGSQGSGHSNASGHSNMSHISGHSNVSHISGQSRLSVISGISRSPSPHKMLLETSFCGPKPLENDVGVVGNEKHHGDVLEQVLLSRKHDPREAIVAEGIIVSPKADEPVKPIMVTAVPVASHPAPEKTVVRQTVQNTPPAKIANVKVTQAESVRKESITSPIITVSTLGSSYKSEKRSEPQFQPKIEVHPKSKSKSEGKQAPSKPPRSSGSSETEYIRIKLKPDHMYSEDDSEQSKQTESMQKPVSLNLHEQSKKNAQHFSQLVKREDSLNKISKHPAEPTDTQKTSSSSIITQSHSPSTTPSTSPKSSSKRHGAKDHGSRTPSPAGITTSRKSSFCSLFKSRETIASPESPTGSASKRKGLTGLVKDVSGSIHSSRSRSKSREPEKADISTPTSSVKSKGSVLAIFKPHRKSSASASPVARESLPNLDIGHNDKEYKQSPQAKSVQNLRPTAKERLKYYDAPVDGFIRIPLHTPSDEEEKVITKEKPTVKQIVKEDLNLIKVDRPVSAPSSSRPSISQPVVTSAIEKASGKKRDSFSKPVALPDGSIRIPLHSPSEDRLVRCDLMSEKEAEELNRKCSKISLKKNSLTEKISNGSVASSSDLSKQEEKKVERSVVDIEPVREEMKPAKTEKVEKVEKIERTENVEKNVKSGNAERSEKSGNAEIIERNEIVERIAIIEKVKQVASEPVKRPTIERTPAIEPEHETHEEERASSRNKKHIIFTTKVGSKEEQLFSLQFSLSKTDSQCSQMSENRSQISEESVIEVPLVEKKHEDPPQRSPSIEAKQDVPVKKTNVEKVVTGDACVQVEITDLQTPIVSLVSSEKLAQEPSASSSKAPSFHAESFGSRNSSLAVDDVAHDSSESERDSELDFVRKKQLQALEKAGLPQPEATDHERKGLVLQQDSFDDELPYIPTTLPMERSVALPIVPVKQRQGFEMKTFPIERPRSITPINPSCLEEYCSDEVYTPDATKAERLKISLPKDEHPDKPKAKQKAKSPRRVSAASNPKTWFEFAEQGIPSTGARKSSIGHESDSDPAPPLPPRAPVPKTQWINFEDIPEKRKLPKRIQTIPSRTNVDVTKETNVVYTYVNPEDCKCECHESGKDAGCEDATPEKEEDEEPLLDDSGEVEGISAPVVTRMRPTSHGARVQRRGVNSDSSLETDSGPNTGEHFNADLDLGSNRSSIISQDRSSSSGSPNTGPPLRRPPRPP